MGSAGSVLEAFHLVLSGTPKRIDPELAIALTLKLGR